MLKGKFQRVKWVVFFLVLFSFTTNIFAASATINFNDYPITFNHVNWLLQSSHTTTTGFSYTKGTGNGQRTDKNGVTWPDSAYYETVLGSGGFNSVNSWNMKPIVIYAEQKNGNWKTNGWNYVQDMAEGAACVDDSARAAMVFIDDYILNQTASSFQTARDILTFVGYMTTREGKVYNFAWLDGPGIFGWDPVWQANDKHFMYRCEFFKRSQYPSASPSSSWNDYTTDPSHMFSDGSGGYIKAAPFRTHPKYSIYMNDLRDKNGNDVAQVYDGPLYSSGSGGITGYKTGIKNNWTTSTQDYGMDDARALWAFCKGINLMQKYKNVNGSLTGDNLAFAKFVENHTNRLMRNFMSYSVSSFDTKLLSVVLSALCDYYYAVYGSPDYGRYSLNLAANSNTSETTDDVVSQGDIYAKMDECINRIVSKQFRSTDWRNGIFIEDSAAGNWEAWGELQIYALAKSYKLKINLGQSPSALNGLLDIATYSADEFYGKEAYHYKVPGTNNVRTKERINYIRNWSAYFHTNSSQCMYYNSSIILGLKELAEAYYLSGRSDASTRRSTYLEYMKTVATWMLGNNSASTSSAGLMAMYNGKSGSGAYEGNGAVFDGITPSGSISVRSTSAGAESVVEGLMAMLHVKKAISQYGLSSTYTFDY